MPTGYSNNGIIVTVFHDMQDYGNFFNNGGLILAILA